MNILRKGVLFFKKEENKNNTIVDNLQNNNNNKVRKKKRKLTGKNLNPKKEFVKNKSIGDTSFVNLIKNNINNKIDIENIKMKFNEKKDIKINKNDDETNSIDV